MEYDRSKQDWVDHPEQIWLIEDVSTDTDAPMAEEAHTTEQGAEAAISLRLKRSGSMFTTRQITLHRPSLRAVYGGPTLIEALWNEMDAIMERLMTGQTNEDGGDKYRAEELAWVLAIVTNAYDPSVDRIRAETMARWNAAQAEAEAQEEDEADPDQAQHDFDAQGVSGYEL